METFYSNIGVERKVFVTKRLQYIGETALRIANYYTFIQYNYESSQLLKLY